MKPGNLAALQKAFAVQAGAFDSNSYHLSKKEYLDYIIEKTSPKKTDTILEVAAGTCICGRALAPYAGHIICLDATAARLEAGKAECEKAGISNITLVQGYAEELPFLANSFDIVISRLAFHHFTEPAAIFREMIRVLKPGGKLIMIDMVPADIALREETDRIETLRDASHIRNLSLREMRKLYLENGLSLELQEQTKIPVSLEAWMDLTNTPEATRQTIRKRMYDDLNGKRVTGFYPYMKDHAVYFDHHWVFNLGRKGTGKENLL